MDLRTALLLPALVILTGLLAGAYPAIHLSRFRPEQALRSRGSSRGPNGWMQALVVLQFMLSIGFIISVLAVSAQLRHLQRMDLGFDRDQLLVVETHATDVHESDRLVARLREEWKALAGVGSVAASSSGLNRDLSWASFGSRDGEAHTYYVNRVDREFLETMGLTIVAGEGFSADYPVDPEGALLVNEALVRDFEWDAPIGEELHNDGRVAGVVGDYFFKSVYTQVEPMALRLSSIGDDPFRFLYVRLGPAHVPETLAGLEAAWRRVAPDRPFSWYFLDDDLERQYASEARVRRLVGSAGILAVVIACLGLFGLSAYAAERRTKEIGIRKAIGAGVPSIVLMLMKEFLGLVIIAAVVVSPIAWILIGRWLEGFAQRIELTLWMPGLATLLAIAIAALTVSYHATRAARADPVRSLRLE
jgi:putative ABC transport system permease protein